MLVLLFRGSSGTGTYNMSLLVNKAMFNYYDTMSLVNKRRCNDLPCLIVFVYYFTFRIIVTFLFEKLCCAVEILI